MGNNRKKIKWEPLELLRTRIKQSQDRKQFFAFLQALKGYNPNLSDVEILEQALDRMGRAQGTSLFTDHVSKTIDYLKEREEIAQKFQSEKSSPAFQARRAIPLLPSAAHPLDDSRMNAFPGRLIREAGSAIQGLQERNRAAFKLGKDAVEKSIKKFIKDEYVPSQDRLWDKFGRGWTELGRGLGRIPGGLKKGFLHGDWSQGQDWSDESDIDFYRRYRDRFLEAEVAAARGDGSLRHQLYMGLTKEQREKLFDPEFKPAMEKIIAYETPTLEDEGARTRLGYVQSEDRVLPIGYDFEGTDFEKFQEAGESKKAEQERAFARWKIDKRRVQEAKDRGEFLLTGGDRTSPLDLWSRMLATTPPLTRDRYMKEFARTRELEEQREAEAKRLRERSPVETYPGPVPHYTSRKRMRDDPWRSYDLPPVYESYPGADVVGGRLTYEPEKEYQPGVTWDKHMDDTIAAADEQHREANRHFGENPLNPIVPWHKNMTPREKAQAQRGADISSKMEVEKYLKDKDHFGGRVPELTRGAARHFSNPLMKLFY